METFDLNGGLKSFSRVAHSSLFRLGAEISGTSASEDLGYAVDAFESIVEKDVYPKSLWATRLRVESAEFSRVTRAKQRKRDPMPEFIPIGLDGSDEQSVGELSLNYVSALSFDSSQRDIHSVSPLFEVEGVVSELADRAATSVLLDGVFVSPTMLREQLPELDGLKDSAFIFALGKSESTLSVWRDVVDLFKYCDA